LVKYFISVKDKPIGEDSVIGATTFTTAYGGSLGNDPLDACVGVVEGTIQDVIRFAQLETMRVMDDARRLEMVGGIVGGQHFDPRKPFPKTWEIAGAQRPIVDAGIRMFWEIVRPRLVLYSDPYTKKEIGGMFRGDSSFLKTANKKKPLLRKVSIPTRKTGMMGDTWRTEAKGTIAGGDLICHYDCKMLLLYAPPDDVLGACWALFKGVMPTRRQLEVAKASSGTRSKLSALWRKIREGLSNCMNPITAGRDSRFVMRNKYWKAQIAEATERQESLRKEYKAAGDDVRNIIIARDKELLELDKNYVVKDPSESVAMGFKTVSVRRREPGRRTVPSDDSTTNGMDFASESTPSRADEDDAMDFGSGV